MLSDAKLYAVVPASDLTRAKHFYQEKLDLAPGENVPDGVIYHCGGDTMFNLYETPNAGTAQNTAMGWSVDDLESEITDLTSKGVTFEKYDMPGVDPETGVVTIGSLKAIWFKDSEGNILCLSQID
jgi:catechol-2,3-dioxygenase